MGQGGRALLVFLIVAVLLGSSHALRKRSGTGAEPQAPVLEFLAVPDIDIINTTSASATFTVNDPAGVKFVGVAFGNESYIVGSATWNATTYNQTATATLPLSIFEPVTGIFALYVTVCDVLENCDTYSDEDLLSAGFQYAAVIYTNVISISCPTAPLSVLVGEAEFDCLLTVHSDPLPVVSYNVFAALYSSVGVLMTTVYPDNGNFDDPDSQEMDVSTYITFRLPQYAPNGTYLVTAEACGPNYLYDVTTTTFNVKAEINDLNAPQITIVSSPTITLPSSIDSVAVSVQVSDDAVGVLSVDVTVVGLGSGSWLSPTPDVIGSDLHIFPPISITPTITTLVQRLYYITISVCDKTNKCRDYTTNDLSTFGLQSTVNIGPVNPNGNTASVACGGPYDVATGPVTVTCTYSVTFVTGIYTYTVFVDRDADEDEPTDPTFTQQATPGFYSDDTGSKITLTSTQTFTLPQYAPYGNYTVTGTAYDDTLLNSVVGTTVFIVSHTLNDMGPPTLRTLSVPVPPNINSFKARVSANDDASGIATIQVYLYSKGTTGVGLDNTTLNTNNRVVTNTEIPINMNVYNSSDSIFFVVEVMLVDVLGNKRYYSTEDLANDGFQANVTLASTSTTGPSTTTAASPKLVVVSVPCVLVALVFILFINTLLVV